MSSNLSAQGGASPTAPRSGRATFDGEQPLTYFGGATLTLLLLALCIYPVAIIVADPNPTTWSFLGSGSLFLVFAGGAVHSVRVMTKSSPALVIDARGIHDRRISSTVIPWQEIKKLRVITQGVRHVIKLELNSAPTSLTDIAALLRHVRRWGHSLLWATSINLNYLNGGRDAVVSAIVQFGPPNLIEVPEPSAKAIGERKGGRALVYAMIGLLLVVGMAFVAMSPILVAGFFRKTGDFYGISFVGSEDRREQLTWYRRALDWGDNHTRMLWRLAESYESGRGVPQNYAEAARLYHILSKKGSSWARARLAWLYDQGLGVEKDPEQAKHWTRWAAIGGNEWAKARWQRLYGMEPLIPCVAEDAVPNGRALNNGSCPPSPPKP